MDPRANKGPSPTEMIAMEVGQHINRVARQFKEYESFLVITQNIMLSIARAARIDAQRLAEIMADEPGNRAFEAEVMSHYKKVINKYSRQNFETDAMIKKLKK